MMLIVLTILLGEYILAHLDDALPPMSISKWLENGICPTTTPKGEGAARRVGSAYGISDMSVLLVRHHKIHMIALPSQATMEPFDPLPNPKESRRGRGETRRQLAFSGNQSLPVTSRITRMMRSSPPGP